VPRFVILDHDHPHQHWDLMLEVGPCLRTWRLPQLPQPGQLLSIEQSFDHRLVYLDYEGPLSENRGTVQRWDCGTYELVRMEDPCLVIRLSGLRIQGQLQLRQVDQLHWTLCLM
jgi:hypothetical protein